MRELPPQPAKPVMPAYGTATPAPAADDPRPSTDDSVIAVDDHFEGTFTSRGTVVVMGSVKGRIEAVRVRIEDGATVEADVIVDEAIIAGEFNGNLTCRQRLEAHASGRINGVVETHKLMLHEGAAVEGEMHMLTEAPTDAAETIRGTASPRGGDAREAKPKTEPTPEPAAPIGRAATTKPAPTVAPSSSAKPASSVSPTSSAQPASTAKPPTASAAGQSADAVSATRQSITQTLREETLRVTPRTTTVSTYSGGPVSSSNGSRTRSETTPTGF
jgi:cytoskeletal protein CcmA (bactofilin family)